MSNIYSINQKIGAICLVASAECNLKCKYCEISKSKDITYSIELQKKIKDAFENGSFLDNIQKTLSTLNQNLDNIHRMTFWGQEPTLSLNSFRKNIKDWFNTFPNIDNIFFSTNGGTDPQIIYNFIKDIDEIMTHDIQIGIQFSYDGEWACKNERYIDPNLIKAHCQQLISLLNSTHLNHVFLQIVWHGVVSFDLISHVLSTNTIKEYVQDLDETIFNASQANHNIKCKIYPITLGLEQPYKASTDDGLALATFIEKGLRSNIEENLHFYNPIRNLLMTLMGRSNFEEQVFDDNIWMKNIIDMFNGVELSKVLNKGHACGSYDYELKIMYDGTLIGCQNFLFNIDKEHIIDNDVIVRKVKENLIDHNFFINVINQQIKKEDIQKVLDRFSLLHFSSFLTTYQSIINTLIMLANAGQISSEYLNNKEKLFKHAFMIVRYNACFFNHLITTGSTFLEPISLCRVLCNGALDLAEQEYYHKKLITRKLVS